MGPGTWNFHAHNFCCCCKRPGHSFDGEEGEKIIEWGGGVIEIFDVEGVPPSSTADNLVLYCIDIDIV